MAPTTIPTLFVFTLAPLLAIIPLVSAACTQMDSVTHTFYGYPDNDPPGPAIAYDCGRGNSAGGTGTYDDPLTFASAEGEFDTCEIIYDPYLRKYLRYEDYCQQCTDDWANGEGRHIDVWTGSTTEDGGDVQIQCENDLTPAEWSQTIVRSPDADLEVDDTPLFADGQCRTDHIYESYDVNDYCSS